MLLQIMERHDDWAVVIALVGGGQEINDGEAGLEEWGRAICERKKPWLIYASSEVLSGGISTAGRQLFHDGGRETRIKTSAFLHLRTSARSLRSEQLAFWVNQVLAGKAEEAASSRVTESFPILLTRSLRTMRQVLKKQALGNSRFGLVGSSGAARLRAEGLEPSAAFHANYQWEHWYLAARSDVRSSFRCEVFATEFEVQGLELDWVGLCWGGDFIWSPGGGWQPRNLRHGRESKWHLIRHSEKQMYRTNAYRVLLTRARQGTVIFIPPGDAQDPTNEPKQFDETAEYLLRCGAKQIE